jgi:hypothetical protein
MRLARKHIGPGTGKITRMIAADKILSLAEEVA